MFPGKGLGRATLAAQSATASIMACCKSNAECYFGFSPFFVKAKILFRFLSVSKTRYLRRSFIKRNGVTRTFEKMGIPVLISPLIEEIITHLMEESFYLFFLFWGFWFDFNRLMTFFLAPSESINKDNFILHIRYS